MHLRYRDAQVDEDGQRDTPGKQPRNHQDAAEEFRNRRDVGQPGRQSKTADKLREMRQSAEYLAVAVANHDGTQHNP